MTLSRSFVIWTGCILVTFLFLSCGLSLLASKSEDPSKQLRRDIFGGILLGLGFVGFFLIAHFTNEISSSLNQLQIQTNEISVSLNRLKVQTDFDRLPSQTLQQFIDEHPVSS